MSQDMCFTMMLSVFFLFKFIFMQCYFDFRCFWWVVEHVWTLQRCSKISKILVCKVFKWLLLISHCLFWERWLVLSTGIKRNSVVDEGESRTEGVLEIKELSFLHRVPCQLLISRPPLTLPLPTIHFFPSGSLSLSDHAFILRNTNLLIFSF